MDQSLRELVWTRAKGRCEYCQMLQKFDDILFEIDHVVARSHGGPTRAANLALACFDCNCFKGTNLAGIDPKTSKVVKLFNPRRHKWQGHFRWHGPLFAAKTPVGRATIAVLRINLRTRVAHRAALIEEGVFPLTE